ncbi:MAG: 23S rRNA (guanosine(2251)-2'-O)-methyltransferase RlmB [Candidatus Goldbacteria bacterium]|nr:23S rRNA (guanosine(2251)-2'-O)-methyltransferase RlmB [Candidatus Goldiibacteriota bacterium]
MWVYGRNVIREVIKNDRKIYELVVLKDAEKMSDVIEEVRQTGAKITITDKKNLEKITGTDKHQGVAASIEGLKAWGIDEFLRKHAGEENITVAVLDSIEDPHNLGAIIRSCEVFGVCGIIVTSKRQSPVNDAAYKVSAGAAEYIEMVVVSNINNALEILKKNGFWIYGLDLKGDKYIDETDFDKKTAFVLGNEGAGMRELVKKNCDFLVKIKQKGRIDSLNVSNAAAVVFYERMRKIRGVEA